LLIPLKEPGSPPRANYYYGQVANGLGTATGDRLNAGSAQRDQLNAGPALAKPPYPPLATLATFRRPALPPRLESERLGAAAPLKTRISA